MCLWRSFSFFLRHRRHPGRFGERTHAKRQQTANRAAPQLQALLGSIGAYLSSRRTHTPLCRHNHGLVTRHARHRRSARLLRRDQTTTLAHAMVHRQPAHALFGVAERRRHRNAHYNASRCAQNSSDERETRRVLKYTSLRSRRAQGRSVGLLQGFRARFRPPRSAHHTHVCLFGTAQKELSLLDFNLSFSFSLDQKIKIILTKKFYAFSLRD